MEFGGMKLILFAWILTLLHKTSGAPLTGVDDEAGQRAWLSRFGYLSPAVSSLIGASHDSGNMFEEAVKKLQRCVGLPETGIVDAEIKGYMKKSSGLVDYPIEAPNNGTAQRKRYAGQGPMEFGGMKLVLFAWLLTFIQKTSGAPISGVDDEAEQRAWLSQFDYMSNAASSVLGGSNDSRSMFGEAVKSLQRFVGLPETGVVDAEMKGYMKKSRCGWAYYSDETLHNGYAQRKKRYVLEGSSWAAGSTLTYRINPYSSKMTQELQDHIFGRAFNIWASVANIYFRQVKDISIKVDFEIKFVTGEHGDQFSFDGPGNTVAHAFFPEFGGDEHYDEDENWTHGTTQGISLLQTAVHQIGHTLGLAHSNDSAAVMWPSAKAYDPNFALAQDDVRGIQAIYGPPLKTSQPTATPAQTNTITDFPVTEKSEVSTTDVAISATVSLAILCLGIALCLVAALTISWTCIKYRSLKNGNTMEAGQPLEAVCNQIPMVNTEEYLVPVRTPRQQQPLPGTSADAPEIGEYSQISPEIGEYTEIS